MSKLKSRKLWAFIVWSVLICLGMILDRSASEELIKNYGIITFMYIGGQSLIDAVKAWKGKDD